MLQRLIRLLGWVFYVLGVVTLSTRFAAFPTELSTVIVIAVIFFSIGRGIIYVAVGPRRNPF